MHLSNRQMEPQTKSAWESWNGYRSGTPGWTPEYNLTGPFKVFSLNTYYQMRAHVHARTHTHTVSVLYTEPRDKKAIPVVHGQVTFTGRPCTFL